MKAKKANNLFSITLIVLIFAVAFLSIQDFSILLGQSSKTAAANSELSKLSQASYSLSIKMIIFTILSVCYTLFYLGKNKRELMKNNQELKIENERYQVITEQSDSIIFDFNFQNKIISFSGNVKKKFGFNPVIKNCPQSLINSPTIHLDDVDSFMRMCADVRSGIPYEECELRLKPINGDYIWCRVRATTIFDGKRQPVKAVGKIIDIDHQKKETQNLRSKAQHDPLTCLYNKLTTERLISACLNNNVECQHALFIMDIDNFKSINDNLGHMFGDAVLHDIAPKMKKLFRGSDIVGRIGGDEFMILMKDFYSDQTISEKAAAFCELLRQTKTGPNKDVSISGSIGIAVYPKDGDNYSELYRKADIALYHAKKFGKNSYSIYEENYNTCVCPESPPNTATQSPKIPDEFLLHNETILNHLPYLTYVIDQTNYNLLYINQKARDLVPNIKLGDKCHAVFWHRQEPCDNCPIMNLSESDSQKPDILSLTTACKIDWGNTKSAVLLCEKDITQYESLSKIG